MIQFQFRLSIMSIFCCKLRIVFPTFVPYSSPPVSIWLMPPSYNSLPNTNYPAYNAHKPIALYIILQLHLLIALPLHTRLQSTSKVKSNELSGSPKTNGTLAATTRESTGSGV